MLTLHEPRFNADDEHAVLEALRSTWVSTGGPFVDQFEVLFSKYVGTRHAISVTNGTIALQLAIECLKRQKGIFSNFDVIVPTLSFIATANSVIHAGGTPVLIDAAPNSMNMDPRLISNFISTFYQRDTSGLLRNRTTSNVLLCIMPAHIMGWTCDMPSLMKIAKDNDLPIIEDAAEALGSKFNDGSHVGTNTLAAAFSFNGNKILTTGGGGMLVTNDDAFANLAKHLSTTAKVDGLRYVHDQVGYNFRMVNLLAAIGVTQIKRMANTLEVKLKIFQSYRDKLRHLPVIVHEEENNFSNNWIINLIFASHDARERALHCSLESQIQVRPLWTPAHMLPFLKENNTLGQSYPNADRIWRHSLSIPSSSHLRNDDIVKVVNAVEKALR
jgi:perosamine synthetase